MTEATSKSSAPFQVILMFAIIIATVLLGFFMLPSTQEERDRLLGELGTTNHGILLNPVRPIDDLPLRDAAGLDWQWQDHKPKWRLLIPTTAVCEGECDKMLYNTRQVHIRLGKYTHRLERILVATDGALAPSLSESIKTEHPYLKVMTTDSESFAQWLAGTNSDWHQGKAEALLVDPAGVAMMVYDARHEGNDMLEDINHLMKYSHD